MLFKIYIIKYIIKILSVLIFLLIFSYGCNLNPIYNKSFSNILCSIQVDNPKQESKHYEEEFKYEMEIALCSYTAKTTKYILEWDITKSSTELIRAETEKTRRYDIKLVLNYKIILLSENKTLYSDSVYSTAAHNIFEDEILSGMASKKSNDLYIVKELTNIIINKIYIFMEKYENSKL